MRGWNWLKFSWNSLDPKADIFQGDSSPRPSGAMSTHAKTLCPGWEVARFSEAAKRESQGDTLTGKQNSSTTLGTSHAYNLASVLLHDLITQMWEKAVQILAVLIVLGPDHTVVREGSLDRPHRDAITYGQDCMFLMLLFSSILFWCAEVAWILILHCWQSCSPLIRTNLFTFWLMTQNLQCFSCCRMSTWQSGWWRQQQRRPKFSCEDSLLCSNEH